MGLYYTLYTGPYVECKTHMIDGSEIRYGCQKVRCKVSRKLARYKNYDFCSCCGSEIKEINWPIKIKAVNDRDFEFNGEELCSLSSEFLSRDVLTDIWQPNISFLDRDTHRSDLPSIQTVYAELIVEECNKFIKKFQPQLDLLRKKYDSVIVKWGVIGYSS